MSGLQSRKPDGFAASGNAKRRERSAAAEREEIFMVHLGGANGGVDAALSLNQ